MHTNAFNGDPWCHIGKRVGFIEATDDTVELVGAAMAAARRAWRPGFSYAKAGLVLTELVPIETVQRSLLPAIDRERRRKLGEALDAVNHRYGRGTLYPAAAGIKRGWSTKFEMRSPAFTTQWTELPIARC